LGEFARIIVRGLLAHLRPQRDPGRQGVHIGLAQRRGVGILDGQAEDGPGMFDVGQRHTDRIGRGAQRVGLRTGSQQGIAGQPEQPALALGIGHLFHGETKADQVIEEPGSRLRVSDPRSQHGVEVLGIDHLVKSASPG
jgi:hypothetical protein